MHRHGQCAVGDQWQRPTERKIEAIPEPFQENLVEKMPFYLSIGFNAVSWLA